jgi:hypothetical protein
MRVGVTRITVTPSINIRRTRSQKSMPPPCLGRRAGPACACNRCIGVYCLLAFTLLGTAVLVVNLFVPGCAARRRIAAAFARGFFRSGAAIAYRSRVPSGCRRSPASWSPITRAIWTAGGLRGAAAGIRFRDQKRDGPGAARGASAAPLGLRIRRTQRPAARRRRCTACAQDRGDRSIAGVLSRGDLRHDAANRQIPPRRICDRRAHGHADRGGRDTRHARKRCPDSILVRRNRSVSRFWRSWKATMHGAAVEN